MFYIYFKSQVFYFFCQSIIIVYISFVFVENKFFSFFIYIFYDKRYSFIGNCEIYYGIFFFGVFGFFFYIVYFVSIFEIIIQYVNQIYICKIVCQYEDIMYYYYVMFFYIKIL